MKTEMSRRGIAIAVVSGSVVICLMLYFMVDTVWNGSFVDWFTRNYTYTYDKYLPETGESMLVSGIDWGSLKVLILEVVIGGAVFFSAAATGFAFIYGGIREKKTIRKTCKLLREYMDGEEDASKFFPEEYAEAAAQMAEIKSLMQRHEQIIKEEAARKSDLITYLAHDLKTPLTSVIGYLSLLEEAPDMPEKQKEKYVGIALDKACRLEKLINEFFEITRYNLQQMELEGELIDLSYMLVQMTDEFYPLLQSKGNKAVLKTEEELMIYADPVKLARVFNNILKNAIAYSSPNTDIEIWTEHAKDTVRIYFQDQGQTIPKGKLDTIFEKFFRLDESRRTNTGGAGLGLAIAKEIVDLHGGEITAKSEGGLTTFCVILPA